MKMNWLKGLLCGCAMIFFTTAQSLADETCQSPYMPKITGQEEFVYVWTQERSSNPDCVQSIRIQL